MQRATIHPMSRPTLARSLGVALACGALSLVVVAPTAVTAKPKPLPGGSSGGSGGGGDEEGKSKCKQCDDEFAIKAGACMDTYDKCQLPCPACTTMSNCDNRKPCMAPCNVKFRKCKDDADKIRKECAKSCK